MVYRTLLFPRLNYLLLATLMAAVLTPGASAQSPRANRALPNHLSKRVIGDYGYWSKYDNPPYGAAQIPYHELTHINHDGVSFD